MTQTPAPAKRRTEIEGLRTVAALLVAFYHIWVGRVSGGVDVFFVVTGFFITLTVLKHVDAGRIRPLAYFGRLIRRLLPSAAIVLAFAGFITLLWAPAPLMQRNFEEIIASSLSFENLYLAFNAVDYLNAEDPKTPVQHFWAMSIQAQFYVLWLLVAALVLLMVKVLAANARKTMMIVLATLVVLSLGLSIWQTAVAQPFAYFVPWTRMWEFAVGGILAILGSRLHLRGTVAAIASLGAVVVLVLTGAVLPVEGGFPGIIAAVPVLAAAAILVSTREDEKWWAGTRLLSWSPLVWLGSIAFGIYLWHWPLLVLYRYWYGLDGQPGILAGPAIIISAIVLAYLTKRLLENPVQHWWRPGKAAKPGRRIVTVGLVLAWCIAVVIPVTTLVSADVRQNEAPVVASECNGYNALTAGYAACQEALQGVPLSPPRAELLDDVSSAYVCYTQSDASVLKECDPVGPDDAELKVAVIGNSHAAMLAPAFNAMAESRNWQVTSLPANGCVWTSTRDEAEGCGTRLEQQEQLFLGDDPFDVVVVVGGYFASGGAHEIINQRIQQLVDAGSKVIAIEDNPRLDEERYDCQLRADDPKLSGEECALPEEVGYGFDDAYWDVAQERDDVIAIPTRDLYCIDGDCPLVIGGVIVYRDEHHLTSTYVATMFPELLSRIDERTDALTAP